MVVEEEVAMSSYNAMAAAAAVMEEVAMVG